jgi:hypothetical protein
MMIYSCGISRRIKQKNTIGQTTNLTGKYSCASSNLYASNIILNRDGSFKYEYIAGDLYTLISQGYWHRSSDQLYLILNSKFRSDSDFIQVDEEKVDSLNKIRICVYDQNDQSFPYYLAINPIIKDSHKEITFDSGLIMGCHNFSMQKVNNLAITYLTIQTKSRYLYYKVKNTDANKFIIHVTKLPYRYRYFINAKWKIGKNRLYDMDTSYNKNCRVFLKQ